MKSLIRSYLVNILALWLLAEYVGGFHLASGLKSLLVVGAGLTFIHLFIRPVIQAVTGPLNFFTFGLVGIIVDVGILYGLTLFFPEVWLSPWTFPGFTGMGIAIAPTALSLIGVAVVSAMVLNLIRDGIILLCD